MERTRMEEKMERTRMEEKMERTRMKEKMARMENRINVAAGQPRPDQPRREERQAQPTRGNGDQLPSMEMIEIGIARSVQQDAPVEEAQKARKLKDNPFLKQEAAGECSAPSSLTGTMSSV